MNFPHVHSAPENPLLSKAKNPLMAGQNRLNAKQPQFSGSGVNAKIIKPSKLLETLDFTTLGTSPVKQVGVIFTSLIGWRLLAANERRRHSESKRWNELRENLMRDLIGFAFWFLGVPVVQRLYLGAVAKRNPQLQNILIQRAQPEAAKKLAKPPGFLKKLQALNLLEKWYIPSSQQVKDQMTQALHTLEKAGVKAEDAAYQQTKTDYLKLIKHRNLATGVGLGSTILLLGIGINLLNFYLTRKNVASGLKPDVQPTSAKPMGQVSAFTTQAGAALPLAARTPFSFKNPVASKPFGIPPAGILPLGGQNALLPSRRSGADIPQYPLYPGMRVH